jgi:Na+-driven multidrug efflux pump
MNENEGLITEKNRAVYNSETVVEIKTLPTQENIPDVTFIEMTKNLTMNIMVYLMYFFSAFMEVKYVGNTKDLDLLNGLNLGSLFRTLFICFFYFGMTQAITINCSKSFGRKDFVKIGNQTNQVRLITFVMFLIYLIFTFTSGDEMLKFIAGDKAYVKIAHEYIIWTIPGVFFDMQYDNYFCYAQAQLLYTPVIVSVASTVISHPTLGYLFILKYNYGMWGVVMAYNLACFIKALVMFIYFFYFTPYPESHIWFRKETFEWSSFKEMFYLCLSCMIILYAEYSGLNILIILSNSLSEISYSIVAIIITIVQATFYMGLAWITTNSAMVGYYIGKNSPRNIRLAVKYSFYLLFLITAPFLTFMFIYKKDVFFFIGHNETLTKLSSLDDILTITVFIQAFTILHSFFVGILRECDLVNTITYLTIGCITVLMPVVCYILVFKLNLDVPGLLRGMLVSYMLTSIILFGLYLTLDYEKVCEKYRKRIEKKNKELDEENIPLIT